MLRRQSMFCHLRSDKGYMGPPAAGAYFKGRFHIYYLQYPHASRWGDMHWSHAVSDDLVLWEDKGVVITPPEGKSLSCGSAVVRGDLLYVFYSIDDRLCCSVSSDGQLFENKEIICEEDLKDPFVFEYEDSYRLLDGNKVLMSDDLVNWIPAGFLADPGVLPPAESSRLIEVDGSWVLILEGHKLRPNRVLMATGEFNGVTFAADKGFEPVETGPDLRCPMVFKDESGRALMLAWIMSGKLSRIGGFTIPREISVGLKDELIMLPADEVMGRVKGESRFVSYENGRLKIMIEGKTLWDKAYKEEPDVLTLEDIGLVELFINGGAENVTFLIC